MARRLRTERLRRGLTQEQLGALAGICAPDVSKAESGRLIPTGPQLSRLGTVLGIDPERLLDEVAE